MDTTGYTTESDRFDNTAIENPYYETTSQKDSLTETIKYTPLVLLNPADESVNKFEEGTYD